MGREAFNAMLAAARGAVQVTQAVMHSRPVREMTAEMGRMAMHGRAELAQALFSQSNAYVPYGQGQQQQANNIQHVRNLQR